MRFDNQTHPTHTMFTLCHGLVQDGHPRRRDHILANGKCRKHAVLTHVLLGTSRQNHMRSLLRLGTGPYLAGNVASGGQRQSELTQTSGSSLEENREDKDGGRGGGNPGHFSSKRSWEKTDSGGSRGKEEEFCS